MTTKPTLLFINLRRAEKERYESLFAAKSLGFNIVLLTNTMPSAPITTFFHHIELTDTSNIDETLEKAHKLSQKYNFSAVPAWTESDIELVAYICERLQLPGLPPTIAQRARNKIDMKNALIGLPNVLPKFQRIATALDLISAAEAIGYPLIIKPAGASGSKGIFLAKNQAEANKAFEQLQKITQPSFDSIFKRYQGEIIAEEYLDGNEFSVEGFATEHDIAIVGITDKWTTDPYHLEYQHIFPTIMPENIKNEIHEKTRLIVKKLGFKNCAFHLEAKNTSKGFRFIEVAARPGGDYITSHLVRISTGINMYMQLINIALGKKPHLSLSQHYYAGVRFILAQKEGTLKKFKGISDILQHNLLEHVFYENPLGTTIRLPPNHFSLIRLLAVITKHHSYSECEATLERIANLCIPNIDQLKGESS